MTREVYRYTFALEVAPVGRDFNRLILGFLQREFGPDSFRVERPPRLLVYGTSDIGKSTFGSQAPSPVFVPIVTLAHHFGWAAAFGSIVPPSQTILHFGNAAASLSMPACVSLTPSLPWLWLTWRYRSVFSLASDSSPASVS